MKVICAWCKVHIDGPREHPRTSHGICKPCLRKVAGTLPTPLRTNVIQERLKHFDIGGES